MVQAAEQEVQYTPDLTEQQERQIEQVESTPLPVIHEVIRMRGEDELARTNASLAWSGLAAGLSMGFSFIAEGLIRARLPHEAHWAPLVSKLGYTVGFLIVVLGRQQLFTENTLTPVLPVMARRNVKTLLQMLRLWVVVLVTNLIGAVIVAWVLCHTDAFDQTVKSTFMEMGSRALHHGFGTQFIRGIFAGWLIAMVVWLLPAVPSNRFWIILLLTWLVGIGELSHIIAGSVETMYAVVGKQATWAEYFSHFMFPALLGNTVGGVSLVAALNHAQTVTGLNQSGGKGQKKEDQGGDGRHPIHPGG